MYLDQYTLIEQSPTIFLEGILLTFQNHGWNNSTNGGHQVGGGDLGLHPLPLWPTVRHRPFLGIMATPGIP